MTSEQPPTWDQILADPVGYGYSEEDAARIRGERTIGQVATLLRGRGQESPAALMLDVQALTYQSRYSDDMGGWGDGDEHIVGVLDVESYLLPRFTEERLSEIKSALDAVRDHEGGWVDSIRVREVLPAVGEGWREALMRDLAAERPSNQGGKVRLEPQRRARDGLYLTNVEEEKVYVVLREVQASLPDTDTIAIAPLTGLRVPEHTYWPDFLVTYRGRVGVIEVDGPHHHGRRGADASRERLLLNAGIRHVGRILVEDLSDKAEVEKWVRAFLHRLVTV